MAHPVFIHDRIIGWDMEEFLWDTYWELYEESLKIRLSDVLQPPKAEWQFYAADECCLDPMHGNILNTISKSVWEVWEFGWLPMPEGREDYE